MPDQGRTDPFADIISLVSGPIAAVIRSFDQLRRGADEMMKGFENFNATMANLNETAERVNRLLNDFEEPARAMLPQITRTVKLADEISKRLAPPLENVIPGLDRLAATLDSPVLRSLPTDLGQFMEVINDLARRMSPLAQIAEQAGGLFGLRIPGFPGATTPATTSAPTPRTEPPLPATSATTRPAPVKTAPVKKPATKKTTAKRRAPAKRAPAKKRPAR
jgi:ABC-type transporter Mla subunit MlaD